MTKRGGRYLARRKWRERARNMYKWLHEQNILVHATFGARTTREVKIETRFVATYEEREDENEENLVVDKNRKERERNEKEKEENKINQTSQEWLGKEQSSPRLAVTGVGDGQFSDEEGEIHD